MKGLKDTPAATILPASPSGRLSVGLLNVASVSYLLSNMKRYEVVNHTADVGIRAYGRDLKELFVNAAMGMFEQIADLENVQTKETFQVNLEAPSYEELLILWLSELLAQNTVGQRLLKEFRIERLDSNSIVSQARGEPIDQARHRLRRELKAVTFHDVKIEKKGNIYSTQIIFDV